MNRRGFLGGLAGIFAAGAAPAIIHDAMKIVVPKQDIILPKLGRGLTSPIFHLDESPFQPWQSKTPAEIHADMMDTFDSVYPSYAKMKEIEKALVDKVRDLAYQTYQQSGYPKAARSVLTGRIVT